MVMTAYVYGKDACPHCVNVKTLLALKGIPYIYHDIEKYDHAKTFVKQVWEKHGAPATVPLVFINEQFVGGYDDTLKFLSGQQEVE